jgi:tetratricopeptide (TPR) repeat protein
VQLFVERAQLQKPSFALTEKDAPAIAELCARLEGIPLALELAAARMRALSLQDINKRLQNRFALLTGGGRVLMERQQTLRALVAWSYDLLTENEQLLFDRLAVFAGGFDLAAAEAVCGVEPLAVEDVLDLVASLTDKSLVMMQEGDDETRYRMLETIREYANEGLVRRDEQAACIVRHCDHFLAVAKAARDQLQGPDRRGDAAVELDLDNLRAAISRALTAPTRWSPSRSWWPCLFLDPPRLLDRGPQGGSRCAGTRRRPDAPVVHAHTLYLWHAGRQPERLRRGAQAARRLLSCGRWAIRARRFTLSTLALIRLNEGDARAGARARRRLVIFRELGDHYGEAIGLQHLGYICAELGEPAEAIKHLERCLELARSIEHLELEGESECALGELALDTNDVALARKRLARSLKVFRDAEDKRGEATALWWAGKADLAAGDLAPATQRLGEALRAFQSFEMNAELLGCLEDHAVALQARGDSVGATRLYAAVEAARAGSCRAGAPSGGAPTSRRRGRGSMTRRSEAAGRGRSLGPELAIRHAA